MRYDQHPGKSARRAISRPYRGPLMWSFATGGIAALNLRLLAMTPPGSRTLPLSTEGIAQIRSRMIAMNLPNVAETTSCNRTIQPELEVRKHFR